MINLSVPTIELLIGAAILFLGRKLFWLFVGAIGFALGVEMAPQIVHQPAPLVTLVIAFGLGIIGALLAILLQKFAIAAAGFLAGGWFTMSLYAFLAGPAGNVGTVVFLVGGLLGAILFVALFDWALIFFSSVAGARFIATAIVLSQTERAILFILLVVVGIAVQSSMLSPARRSGRR
jgi:hypothetical protein